MKNEGISFVIKIIAVIFLIAVFVSVIPEAYLRLFGNSAEQGFYVVGDIIDSYGYNFAKPRLFTGCSSGGDFYSEREYEKLEDGSYKYTFLLGVEDPLENIIKDIPDITEKVRNELSSADNVSAEITFFKTSGNVCITFNTSENEIILKIGIGEYIGLVDTLKHISAGNYSKIEIYGYHGYDFSIPDDFSYEIISDIDYIEFYGFVQNEASEKLKEYLIENNKGFME